MSNDNKTIKKKKVHLRGIEPLIPLDEEELNCIDKYRIVSYAVRVTNTYNSMKQYYDRIIQSINNLDDCPYEFLQKNTTDEYNMYGLLQATNSDSNDK